ncbi:unnamed protein product [Bursaphelenchus okinawaensis]|uniref:Uncharacterized protein n=1 Tax=Bursaphelenchus okinawaensis TaxID=465554 RepID=A0A811LE91_9BILA|nr:unnamed protein product [Bursaphelenchus okinawaensis]CAG9120952.1 unnamed protein product [Bursaphelenchus okinawaensis]
MAEFFSSTTQRLRDIKSLQQGDTQMTEYIKLLDQIDQYADQHRLNNYERVMLVRIRQELTSAMLDNGMDYMQNVMRLICKRNKRNQQAVDRPGGAWNKKFDRTGAPTKQVVAGLPNTEPSERISMHGSCLDDASSAANFLKSGIGAGRAAESQKKRVASKDKVEQTPGASSELVEDKTMASTTLKAKDPSHDVILEPTQMSSKKKRKNDDGGSCDNLIQDTQSSYAP